MLVLSRKSGDAVVIDGDITVKVIDVRGGVVRLGIEAPKEIPVYRDELCGRLTGTRSERRLANS